MNVRSLDYGTIKLKDALHRIEHAGTLYEGLYDAYMADIQWLAELEDVPGDVTDCIRRLNRALTRIPAADLAASARATISRLSPAEGAALAQGMAELARRIEAIANRAIRARSRSSPN